MSTLYYHTLFTRTNSALCVQVGMLKNLTQSFQSEAQAAIVHWSFVCEHRAQYLAIHVNIALPKSEQFRNFGLFNVRLLPHPPSPTPILGLISRLLNFALSNNKVCDKAVKCNNPETA